jgi:hypothetical protein
MIRVADAGLVPDADLVARMIAAIDQGLYRLVPSGPVRLTTEGAKAGDVSEWTDESLDLADAACDFLWHPLPPGPNDPDPLPRGRIVVRKTSDDALPTIRINREASMMIDHAAIASEGSVIERIRTAGRTHLEMARMALACRPCTDAENGLIDVAVPALVAMSIQDDELDETVMVRVGNDWAPSSFQVSSDDFDGGMRRMTYPPDPELVAMLPSAIAVFTQSFPGTALVSQVTVAPLSVWLGRSNLPDAVGTLRALTALRDSAP